ncbi:MAG: GDYXXLXY domain-containing protein [Planctomycetes bacterium]|nr:GDYXXLXY domain-containing protein [Planctomycetota bacterium]
MRKRILFYAAIALQIALLLGMIGRKTYTMAYGQRIVLKCAPIDPRSLFRGDYVILNYEISRPNLKSVKGLKDLYQGQPVYVALRKSGAFWNATGVYSRLPKLSEGEVFIKGRASRGGTITYGIESYFVPEGKGWAIERNRAELTAEIALDRFGHPVLMQVFLDGRAVP